MILVKLCKIIGIAISLDIRILQQRDTGWLIHALEQTGVETNAPKLTGTPSKIPFRNMELTAAK